MSYYNLRGIELDFVPRLTSREEIENVDLEEGRLLKFQLRVKSFGDVSKIKTASFGAKDFLEVVLVGEDPDYEVYAEAWSTHVQSFLKLCSVDTVFAISFHAKAKGTSMFATQQEWRIRLNSEVKISDIVPDQRAVVGKKRLIAKKKPVMVHEETDTSDVEVPVRKRIPVRKNSKKVVEPVHDDTDGSDVEEVPKPARKTSKKARADTDEEDEGSAKRPKNQEDTDEDEFLDKPTDEMEC